MGAKRLVAAYQNVGRGRDDGDVGDGAFDPAMSGLGFFARNPQRCPGGCTRPCAALGCEASDYWMHRADGCLCPILWRLPRSTPLLSLDFQQLLRLGRRGPLQTLRHSRAPHTGAAPGPSHLVEGCAGSILTGRTQTQNGLSPPPPKLGRQPRVPPEPPERPAPQGAPAE